MYHEENPLYLTQHGEWNRGWDFMGDMWCFDGGAWLNSKTGERVGAKVVVLEQGPRS
jgi:hypothetical protein